MNGARAAMSNVRLAARLDGEWTAALEAGADAADPEADRLVGSPVRSIRYAVLTQLLGKVADPSRDLLCLQRGEAEGAEEAGRWDPRSFCSAVVVPWVQRNRDVLGTSADPYVSNPLRRPRLDGGEALRQPAEWAALAAFLRALEDAGTPAAVEDAARRCLRSAARRLNALAVEYPAPLRLSLDRLAELIDRFLAGRSRGLRPLAVTTALMRTLGEAFALFSRVEGQGLNEPDAARGMPADVMCYGPDGELRLAVEVKDRDLTLADAEATLAKSRRYGIANVLFAAPGVRRRDADAVRARIADEWAKGANVYRVPIAELARAAFVLPDERWRVRFARAVGAELDARGAEYRHRRDWSDLLAAS